jgi:hypothetical protein
MRVRTGMATVLRRDGNRTGFDPAADPLPDPSDALPKLRDDVDRYVGQVRRSVDTDYERETALWT